MLPTIDWSPITPVNFIVGGAMRCPNMPAKNISHHPRLIAGGLLFDVGRAIAGFCLGPVIIAVSPGYLKV
jgi:hypothetical protein